MTINLKHKIQETQEQQTRKPTVNYIKAKVNADGTYTPDGSAFTSAVLDVYYSRTKSKDLVTKKVTYTPWLWDTKQGQNGYHVESGKWTSLPQQWAAVVADVPTLDGYTAATITDKSGQLANQFVFPTWNNSDQDTSDINKESIAYTANAPIYEARPVHTVLYIPNETQTRTVTENYVYADAGDLTGEEVFSPYKLEIFYKKTGSLNVSTNTITYSGWSWDTDAGDSDTPGFHVISGQGNWTGLGSNGQPSGSSLGINVPTKDGYTAIISAYPAAIYSSTVFGNPGVNSGTGYTNDTDSTWYWRNSLTTYYVPNSKLSKTVTRTINITQPGKETETTVQKSTITRTAHLNVNDSGIAYSDWGTDSMYWYALNVPKVGGYTMTVTKTVNGVTTPIQLVNGQIPAETVNGTSQDTTINITWGAVATATLTGTGTSTYNGQAITNAELNNALKVNVTGPTAGAGTYTLQAGDVEFSTDGTNWTTALPINAGNYQVRLTAQGKNGIIGKYGNNSIIWTQNGQSTITSNATYMINKLADNAVMANAQSGNYEMTYNGAAPSTIDPSKFVFTTTVNGQTVTLDATGLNSSDFTWADGNAPVNVGTYKVVLTDAGLAKLNANNPNFDLTNSGNGTFTINQANASATLSGSASREYNGQAVSVDDLNSTSTGNNITLTLHYPKDGNANYSTTVKLNTGYFTWNTPNGQAPVNANDQPYTISLNSDAIEGIIKQAVGSGQNGVSNVKFANNAISGSASYKITPLETAAELSNITDGNYTKVYDAQATNQIDASKLHITANLGGQNVDLDTTGLTGSDYQWVDASGTALTYNPKNVGTYYIKLSDTAFAKLQAQNPNFQLTSNDGLGVYTITPTTANITFGGTNSRVYNGQGTTTAEINSNGQIKIHFTFPGSVSDASYTLKDRDYYLVDQAGAGYDGAQIINVGTYTIKLTQQGMQNVIDTIHQLSGSGDSGYNINVDSATQLGNLTSTFNIVPSQNMISVSGTQTETYNGSPINVVYNADGTNSVKVSIAQTSGNTTGAVASLTDVTLDSGDFAIVNGPAENAGSYQVKLTDAGLAKIQNAVGDNYHISIDPNAFGTLVIKKYKASAVFSGDPSYTYTGTPVSADDYLGKYSITLNEPNNPTYNLVAGDIEFNVDGNWTSQAPVKVGTYQVRLSQSGWNHIKAINSDNVEWAATASAGKGSYTIDQAEVTADLSGNNSMIYNGSHVTTADLYTEGSTIKVAINGTGIANLPKSFTLEDGDYTWSTSDNQSPVNVGNYTIKLTQAGINKIQSQIDQVVGAGNVVLTTTADDGGSASFEIKQAVAANVQLYGRENTIYNGNPVSFDPTKTETANNFGFHNVENLTVPTFTASDFTWYDGQGNKLSSAPTNAGTYYLKLNTQGEKAFADANPNYTFEENGKSTISGEIPYVVTPAELTIGVSGSASKVFNDKNAEITQEQINNGDIKLVWGNSTTEPTDLGKFTLTPSDLEVVDANGKHAIHANAGIGADGQPVKGNPYKVQLTADAIKRIKQLSGAANYKISQSAKSGEYFIYEHKAELTLTGNQTTVYGTAMPFSPSKYQLAFTNWLSTDLPVPNLTWKDNKLLNNDNDTGLTWTVGDLYVEGYPDGGVPTNVGTYQVKLSEIGQEKLKALTGNQGANYKWAFNTNADYVVKAATASAELSGSNQKTFDGTAVTTAEVNSNGQILVHLTYPGSNVQSTYTLQDGDYIWETEDGQIISAPTNTGTYTIKLNKQAILVHLQAALNQQAGLGDNDQSNVTVSADKLSGQASFKINPQTLTDVTISAPDQSKTYDAQAADLDVNGITITANGIVANNPLVNPGISASDFTWYDETGNKLESAPVDVGTYQARLNASTLAELQNTNPNYQFSSVAGLINYTINPAPATAKISGSADRDYNAQTTSVSDVMNNIKWKATGLVTDQELNLNGLTANSYAWYSKDADGNYVAMTGNPVNAGTYYLRLTKDAIAQVKADNSNYNFTSVDGEFTYTINVVNGTATLRGSSSKTYDGQAATTAEVNSTNGDIIVNFAFPGSSAQSTYALQAGDYIWENKDGQEISAPTNAGTYTIKLSADGITNLQNAINQYAGQGNVTLDAQDLLGAAVYTIKQKALNVILGNNSTGTDGKTYDGQPAVINTQAENFGVFTTSGLVNGEDLNAANLTNDDYEWVDANGKAISAPTNAGTYYISLTANGLKKLQADNPNYAISESGQFTYVISPAEENVTISGSQESTSTSIDNANFTVHAPAGITVPTGMTYEFATGVPSESGVYVIKLTPESIAALEKTNPNYKLNISSDARFTLDATLSIEFEDTQDGNKQVGKTITKTGVANSTINDLKLVVPDNYELAPDQELPTSYTFGKTLNQNLYIKLVHKLNELNPTDPSTNPDPTNKNWFRENGLVKDVTRTINYEGLSTAQLAQIPETQKAQTVEFTRTAKYDLVTGKIVVNSEGSWTAVDGKDIFAGFTPFAFAGYTAAPAKVEQVKVTGNDKNSQITVTYTANNQTGKISYVDSDGKEVGQTTISGKTGETVKVTPEAPTGWQIVSGQDIPETVVATPTGVPTVVVKVTHSTITVTPETPEKDIPTGPVPGDPSKNYEKMESLTASPTRTIVVSDPSGKTTEVTQTVNFTRMATFDEVTGEITYSNWASSEPAEWSEYTAPEVAGYTATSSVSAKPVTAKTADETVSISYTANNQTGKISYVDGDGKEVGQTTISGQTGETVNVTPQVPSGWKIVPGQDIPKTITISENGIPTVTVKVEHGTVIVTPDTPEKDIPTGPVPGDLSKNYEKMESLTATPTRTIVVTDPSGKTTKVTQTVNFTRTATFDEVTGRVTYSDWKLQNSNASNHAAQWDSYTPHVITHYVPSVAEVPAKVVNSHTANSQVEITYAPASESQVIRYVDQNGKEISTQIVSGKYGLDTTFTAQLRNNWQAANTIPTSIKIGENGGLTTIIVEAKTEKVQQSKTVTETIHYHTANGKQLFADKEMEVNFFRTGVKNLVTGEITWNNWNKDKESLNEVLSPKVSGYTASPAKVAAQTVTPNSEDLVFNVIYTKNSQTYPTIPENKPNKPQEENVSKQETKTQDKLIHEYGYKKRADGRLVDHTGHVYPASSKVKENGAIYSEKGELLSVGSRRKHELPQTGLHDNSLIAAIGSLLAGISIFGLLGGRKKKDDDK